MSEVRIDSMDDFDRAFGPDPFVWLNDRVGVILRAEADAIEARLRAGENRVEYTSVTGQHIVIEAPRWRDHPITRLRIALARRRTRTS